MRISRKAQIYKDRQEFLFLIIGYTYTHTHTHTKHEHIQHRFVNASIFFISPYTFKWVLIKQTPHKKLLYFSEQFSEISSLMNLLLLKITENL